MSFSKNPKPMYQYKMIKIRHREINIQLIIAEVLKQTTTSDR